MELSLGTDLSELCRVCTQDVAFSSSENIYVQASPDCLSIYTKLNAICSQIFAAEYDQKSQPVESHRMPQTVCSDCRSKIESAYRLHQTCIESHRKLWEMLTGCPAPSTVKQENEAMVPIEATQPQQQFAEVFVETLDPEKEVASKAQVEDESTDSKTAAGKSRKPRQYRCERCSATMNRPFAVKKHMKLKHQDEIFYCSSGRCDEVFFTEEKLEEHKLIHSTGLRHACHICQKRCKSLYYLREHMHNHTGETPYLCPECGKAFSNKPSLRQHLVRHSDEKAFVCCQCPSKFHTKGALKVHMLTHTKEKNFPCETCGARFNLKHALFSHIMVHTNERPHGCNICDMKFRTSDHLKRHIRTHTGEKPYKCSTCDRSFAQSNDLVKHSKTHFGENPYQCDRCEASFRLITDLRNHYKVHFQPGDNEESDTVQNLAARHLEKQDSSDAPDVIQFTIVSTLNRRAEQEKKRGKLKAKPQSDAQRDVEMVQTILADLSEFPLEMDNRN
ncbi:zinc finger protein OZF-like [Ochlerotatus camptorhynchus]|uniref:zinc finger protein OZF-like n=1 Tax=Ochlerotatus camptorhynchus TaxID=644619 RepID=UPI0031D69CE3